LNYAADKQDRQTNRQILRIIKWHVFMTKGVFVFVLFAVLMRITLDSCTRTVREKCYYAVFPVVGGIMDCIPSVCSSVRLLHECPERWKKSYGKPKINGTVPVSRENNEADLRSKVKSQGH